MAAAALDFRNLLGQDKARKLLQRSFQHERLSHAFLFRGPAGVGKKRAAATFAAYINCREPLADDCCGLCPSCRKFFSHNHPDFLDIRPDGASIKIGQIRELKQALSYPAFEARYRVVLLSEAHNLRRETANSLLKTLEEPPADTIIILTADESGSILPTILSRCQVVPFFSLPYALVGQTLAAESTISPEHGAVLAAVAAGSIGRARMLQEKKLLPFRQEIVEALMTLEADQAETVEVVLALAEKAVKLKENLLELFDLLKIWLRDLLFLQSSLPELVISRDCFPPGASIRQKWSPPELTRRLGLIDQARKQLERNCNRALVCEVLFFNLL